LAQGSNLKSTTYNERTILYTPTLAMSSARFAVVVVALAGGLMATLQGCGGGGGGTTTTTTTTTTPAVWKWTKGHPKCKFDDPSGKSCVQPADGNAMAKYLTENYGAFDPKKITDGALGVYITMQDAKPDSSGKLVGDLHHYCRNSPCFQGRADCILSVALYNRHIMLDGDTVGAHLKTFAGRCAGYVLNTSKSENKYNKCAYLFDGASSNRLYFGCGDAATGSTSCDNKTKNSAFYNICPSTGKTCQPGDKEVRPRNDCTKITSGPLKRPWPVRTDETPCYFTGPAFAYPDYSEAKSFNKMTQMVTERIKDENAAPGDCSDPKDQCPNYPPQGANGYCCKAWNKGIKYACSNHQTDCNRMAKWNEIVMDLRPMIDDLEHDPNGVIVAFVYGKSCKPQGEALRTAFKERYGGPGDAPLIFLDQTVNVLPNLKKSGTPFVYQPDPTREEVGALTWDEADEFERWMMTGKDEPSVSV